MATINNTSAFPNQPLVEVYKTAELDALSSGDVIEMITVPSGFRVVSLTIRYTNDDGSTGGTFEVGDGVDDDRFVTSQSIASGASVTYTGNTASANGYLYPAVDTIDITLGSTPGAGDVSLTVQGYFNFS